VSLTEISDYEWHCFLNFLGFGKGESELGVVVENFAADSRFGLLIGEAAVFQFASTGRLRNSRRSGITGVR
jgi:hypothetical protein